MDSIITDKQLSIPELKRECMKVLDFEQDDENLNVFVGNKILYHFQMENLCKTHRKNKKSLVEIVEDVDEYEKLKQQVAKRSRTGTMENKLFECWRINSGSISFFKMCNATYMYHKYGATKVLDPTAGWGGRMLGAINQNIKYTGCDTNINLKEGYDDMIEEFPHYKDNLKMIWQDALTINFEELDYDFVLTSPPYEDIEIYENFEYQNEATFYNDFLIPLIEKCIKYNKGTYTCFNIAPNMYIKLTKKYKFIECDLTEDLKEQKNGKASDMIYIWTK